MIIVIYIFWFSLFLLVHTYILYPVSLNVIFLFKKSIKTIPEIDKHYQPTVSILLAVYNEELVIEEKIVSTFNTDYPLENVEFLIGSDACTDKTESIIQKYQLKYPQLKLVPFGGRTGKPEIINSLQKVSTGEILVITDANVFFENDTIQELTKHYTDSTIGLVGGNIINSNVKSDGISHQETSYLKGENKIKYLEGKLWGAMMGTFGGVFSTRSSLYEPVPSKFTVDDFYITLSVIEKGYRAILELNALAIEDVSNSISEEFRRKVRISQGNFQNAFRFKSMLTNPFNGSNYAFFSHKFLRWIGPFLILLMLGSSGWLMNYNKIYYVAFIGEISFLMLPFVDSCLKIIRVDIKLLRFVSHFVWMNIALLKGFYLFVTGVKTNIWMPTERFQ